MLGSYLFAALPNLKTVQFANSVTEIHSHCFANDYMLFGFSVPETVSYIGTGAFSGYATWYQAQTEDFVILGDGILCKYFGTDTEIVIPDSVKQICGNAFTATRYYDLPNGKTIAVDTTNLAITQITVPDTVSVIADDAFLDLAGLQTVNLPMHLEKIGSHAFDGCTSLTNIDIPKTVQHIGESAFDQNPWLSDTGDYVILGDGLLYRFQGQQKILNVPEQVKTILNGAISGNKIVEINLSAEIRGIESNAVACKNAVIVSEPGGVAAQYAEAEGLPFRSNVPPKGKDLTLDYAKDGWYFGNSGSIFGSDYALTDADRQQLADYGIDTRDDKTWNGSCVGLAITVILAKNGLYLPSQLQTDAKTISEIEPTEDIVSFINYYQCTQGKDGTSSAYEADYLKCYRMLNIAKNIPHGASPFLLTFTIGSGSHGVVGYGQESGAWTFDGKEYDGRILYLGFQFSQGVA